MSSDMWVGATTPTSAWVRGKTGGTSVRLAVSEHENLSDPTFFGPESPDATSDVTSIRPTGLHPDTRYWCAWEIDSTVDTDTLGRFRTHPPEDEPADFTIASASCAAGGTGSDDADGYGTSNSRVFDQLVDLDPLMFVHTGDLHYFDIEVNDPDLYRDAYDDVLTHFGNLGPDARQGRFLRQVPTAYMWDNHDYMPGSGAWSGGVARPAIRTVYRERVPHYTLPAGDGDSATYQAWKVGRVLMVLSDLVSERSSQGATDGPSKTMMGADQKEWFKTLLTETDAACICWFSTMPWIGEAISDPAHQWWAYNHERTELGDFIADNDLTGRLLMVSGDAHMLAADDGRNNQWGGFPVFQFAALDAAGSVRGGPYVFEPDPGRLRFGTVRFNDDGDRVQVTATGIHDGNPTWAYTFETHPSGWRQLDQRAWTGSDWQRVREFRP